MGHTFYIYILAFPEINICSRANVTMSNINIY